MSRGVDNKGVPRSSGTYLLAGPRTAEEQHQHALAEAQAEALAGHVFAYLPRWQSARKVVSA